MLSFFVLSALVAGCGEEGAAGGATLSVYVSQPLCAVAKDELDRVGGRAGGFRLRAVCVEDEKGARNAHLAAIGAAARRATEDSASIAYIGTDDPTAIRFSEPILDEAGIARISTNSGSASMRRLLQALRHGEEGVTPRELVSH